MTLLAFVGFFVAFGVATGGGLLHGIAALVAGVFLGSALWWSPLCVGIGKLRHSIDPGLLHRINCFSALGIAGRSEEHTSELQSLMRISYAVFCLKKKKKQNTTTTTTITNHNTTKHH